MNDFVALRFPLRRGQELPLLRGESKGYSLEERNFNEGSDVDGANPPGSVEEEKESYF